MAGTFHPSQMPTASLHVGQDVCWTRWRWALIFELSREVHLGRLNSTFKAQGSVTSTWGAGVAAIFSWQSSFRKKTMFSLLELSWACLVITCLKHYAAWVEKIPILQAVTGIYIWRAWAAAELLTERRKKSIAGQEVWQAHRSGLTRIRNDKNRSHAVVLTLGGPAHIAWRSEDNVCGLAQEVRQIIHKAASPAAHLN